MKPLHALLTVMPSEGRRALLGQVLEIYVVLVESLASPCAGETRQIRMAVYRLDREYGSYQSPYRTFLPCHVGGSCRTLDFFPAHTARSGVNRMHRFTDEGRVLTEQDKRCRNPNAPPESRLCLLQAKVEPRGPSEKVKGTGTTFRIAFS